MKTRKDYPIDINTFHRVKYELDDGLYELERKKMKDEEKTVIKYIDRLRKDKKGDIVSISFNKMTINFKDGTSLVISDDYTVFLESGTGLQKKRNKFSNVHEKQKTLIQILFQKKNGMFQKQQLMN